MKGDSTESREVKPVNLISVVMPRNKQVYISTNSPFSAVAKIGVPCSSAMSHAGLIGKVEKSNPEQIRLGFEPRPSQGIDLVRTDRCAKYR